MNIAKLDCLPINLHDSHTSNVYLDDYKFTLEFDYIVDESEKEPPNDRGLLLSFVLNRQYYKNKLIPDAVTSITLKNRRKRNMDDFISCYSLSDYLKFLNSNGEKLEIYDIYFQQGGCMILAEQTVNGGICGNWVVIQLAVDEINYEWID